MGDPFLRRVEHLQYLPRVLDGRLQRNPFDELDHEVIPGRSRPADIGMVSRCYRSRLTLKLFAEGVFGNLKRDDTIWPRVGCFSAVAPSPAGARARRGRGLSPADMGLWFS